MKYISILLLVTFNTTISAFLISTVPSFRASELIPSLSFYRETQLFFSSSSSASSDNTTPPSESFHSDDDEEDDDAAVEEPFLTQASSKVDAAWRYVKKPFLRIGDKGVAQSHANSLCELLNAHTLVKVKINSSKNDDDWKEAFENLKRLAEESGKVKGGVELIQYRASEKIVLCGKQGAMEMIEKGEFPPRP